MSAPPPARLPLWLQASLIVLLGGLITGWLFNRTSWADWSNPHWLEGDPLEVYLRVKIAAEQPGATIVDFTAPARLGAPTGADWSAYPVPDHLVFALTGLLSRLTGLIAAMHLVGALFAGLNAASFYLCARWLRCRWEWATALGLGFAFCNYNVRWGITLSLCQTFVLPPLILLCAWTTRNGEPSGKKRRWKILAAGLGLWLGLANPYLFYFAGVIAGGTLLLGLIRRTPYSRKMPLLLFLGCLVGSFLLSNASYLSQRRTGSTPSALIRSPRDFVVYALRPIEWFIPPADHRISTLAAIGRDYQAARRGEGEFFYNYLGLFGIAGLAGLIVSGICRLRRGQPSRLDPVLGLGWIMAFGVVGGINSWLGLIGFDLFRASTRIAIYAHGWILFFACGWISRKSLRLPPALSLFLAAVTACFLCWEGTPPLGDSATISRNTTRWENYQDLTTRLETTLPSQAAVFQLPVIPFPEAGRTGAMPDYEHVLPILTSQSLRFSYGHLLNTPALAWARSISQLPPDELTTALEQAGFSALWLDQRAYPDGGQALIQTLQELGLTELTSPEDAALPVRVFRLNASTRPQAPDYTDPRLQEQWLAGPMASGQPQLLALSGWFALEQNETNRWRWVTRAASLGIWWDREAATARLRFRLGGPATSVVTLRHEGQPPRQLETGPQIQEIEIQLNHGLTILEWRLLGSTFKPGGADPRELGFMVENLSVSVP